MIPPILSALAFESPGPVTPLRILPVQFFAPPKVAVGVKSICHIMLDDAMLEVRRFTNPYLPPLASGNGPIKSVMQFLRTLAWIDGADAPLNFETVCWACNVDPERTRAQLKAEVREAWQQKTPRLIQVAEMTARRRLTYNNLDQE